jgi:hypothetical protein
MEKKEGKMIDTQLSATAVQKHPPQPVQQNRKPYKKYNKPYVKDGDDRRVYRKADDMIRSNRPRATYAKCVCGGTLKPRGACGPSGGLRSRCNGCGKSVHTRVYKGAAGLANCYVPKVGI